MAGLRLVVLSIAFVFSTKYAAAWSISKFSEANWDGNVAYFVVPKEKVANKLAELQLNPQSNCESGKLTLPSQRILPAILGSDEHLVAVAFGVLEATSVPKSMQDQYSIVADTVQFYIPFLTTEDPENKSFYKLSLGSFVSTDKPFANPNPKIPSIPVESIVVSHSGVFMKDGAEWFSLSLPVSKECVTPNKAIEEELEDYNQEYTVSFDNDCACQYWVHESLNECNIGALRVEGITSKFREISLLAENQSPAILSVANKGDFHVGVKTPCM